MIENKTYNIKIVSYSGYLCDETLYWRYKLPYRLVVKYRWYFEYLTALMKIRNPHKTYRLTINEFTGNILCGEDYVKMKIPSKLKGRYRALRMAQNECVELDLFGFAEKAKTEKVENIMREIARLEQGYFDYPIFDEYINKINRIKP